MSLNENQITAQNFKDFYNCIRPYLCGSAHGGFTPIGTVISVMGKTAPLNYLVCDGTVYNIADYPELASYFAGQFDSANFFGGDGTTTFAVPDLRGEFLRGSGTNSHSGQGNGGNVGAHQDATEYAVTGTSYEGNKDYLSMPHAQNIGAWAGYANADKTRGSGTNGYIAMSGSNDNGRAVFASARPTNTSVLYCIATKNIFMDAGSNYSTDELVVGTWIDGKPVYQKTFTGTTTATTSSDSVAGTIANLGTLVDSNGTIFLEGAWGVNQHSLPYNNVAEYYVDTSNQIIVHKQNEIANSKGYMITLRYTKTTD